MPKTVAQAKSDVRKADEALVRAVEQKEAQRQARERVRQRAGRRAYDAFALRLGNDRTRRMGHWVSLPHIEQRAWIAVAEALGAIPTTKEK